MQSDKDNIMQSEKDNLNKEKDNLNNDKDNIMQSETDNLNKDNIMQSDTEKNISSSKFKLICCEDINNDSTNDSNYITETKFNINFNESDIQEKPKIEYGYNQLLNDYRNKIDKIDNDIWKKIRWYINEYDFIVKYPIINRAFYKYWEMINEFDIFSNYNRTCCNRF